MESDFCLKKWIEGKKISVSYSPQERMQAIELSLHLPVVIVIAGPTAVGKTHLSIRLAQALGGEIVSADSMQVYRGMDIGTAKPTLQEQRLVAHHMIDVRDVTDPMNVADFYEEATGCLRSICARGKVAVVVGGSGFYVDALIRGAPSGPPADPFVRAHLDAELERLGTERLYAQLELLDPEYAKTITHGDRHKIVRALEIMILTQSKVSEFIRHQPKPTRDFHFISYFLHRPRPILYDRINRRCELMIHQGLIQEVQELTRHGLLDNPSAANAIGYRQTLEFLKGTQTSMDLERYMALFQQASRHYAKRQFTWFRRDPSFHWIDLEVCNEDQVIECIIEDYRRHHGV